MAELNEEAEIQKHTVSLNLPIFDSKQSFTGWKGQFLGYCTLLKFTEQEQLNLLPLCFPNRKYDGIFEAVDGRSTVRTILDRLQAFVRQEQKPSDPLQHFMERSWNPHETSFEFIRDLRTRAGFITSHAAAIDDLVRAHLLRSLPPSLGSLCATDSIDDIARRLSSVPRELVSLSTPVPTYTNTVAATSSNVICFNCERPGHFSSRCRLPKSTCATCAKKGHLAKFCVKVSKNMPKNGVSGSLP